MRYLLLVLVLPVLAFSFGCATSAPKQQVSENKETEVTRSIASSNIRDEFRSKTLDKIANALRSGDCPVLNETRVSGANGGWVSEWEVVAELFRQRSSYDRRNLNETLIKMVEGSGSTIVSLDDFKNIPSKYQTSVENLTVRGPQSFFVLQKSGKETVLQFGPYSNGAIRCESIN